MRTYLVRHPDILLSIKLSRFANLYDHKVQFRPLYISYQAFSLECLVPPPPRFSRRFPFTVSDLLGDQLPNSARSPRCLIPAFKVILPIQEKSRKTDPGRIRSGSIYSRGFRWTDRGKYVPYRQTTEIKSLGSLPRELIQNSRSDAARRRSSSRRSATRKPPSATTRRARCRSPIRASCSGCGSGLRRRSSRRAAGCGTSGARTQRAAGFRRRSRRRHVTASPSPSAR